MTTMATLAPAAEKKMNPEEKRERKPQRARVDDKFKIFCGTANQPLADEVCAYLDRRGREIVTSPALRRCKNTRPQAV